MSIPEQHALKSAATQIGAALHDSFEYERLHRMGPAFQPMNCFARFWIGFWYRVGWEQRAQSIIIQNLKVKK